MRRNPVAMFASILTVVGGLCLAGAPAGAAGLPTHPVHSRSGVPGVPVHGHITNPVAPISNGYLEVFDSAGALSLTPGTVPMPTFAATTSDLIIQLVAPSFPGQIPGPPITVSVYTGSTGVPLTVGTKYGSGATGSVTVTSTNNCGSQMNGDTATAVIDQLTTIGNQVTSAAVQFNCSAGSGPYQALYGAFAYMAVPTTPFQGYYSYESNGAITGFGNDSYLNYLGDLSIRTLNQPVVGMAQTAHGGGYWLVASDGGIFAYGDAGFFGSAGNLQLNKPIVGMAANRNGPGYWLVASDGGIFAYGDAGFHGSTGNIVLNKPVVGMTSTSDGMGYWFVATDGGIFAYGDAAFHGSTGGLTLNQPIVGMAATSSGAGYWLAAADGGIFGFNAPYLGSLPGAGISVTDVAGLSTLPGLQI